MEISASMVMELREKTGVGMMQCKKALLEASGDMLLAVENLRKKGAETAAKRAGRASKEGKIATKITENTAAMVEVNTETDFVARNSDFLKFVDGVLGVLAVSSCKTLEELAGKKLSSGLAVKDALNDMVAKIGEEITIRRFEQVSYNYQTSRFFSYIHGGGKIGVLLEVRSDSPALMDRPEFAAIGKELTLQIAASNPLAVGRDQVDATGVEKEREIYRAQAINEGKPEKILNRIVDGKMVKFYQTVCLLEQPFVREADKAVCDVIAEAEKTLGGKIQVVRFSRYVLGGGTQ